MNDENNNMNPFEESDNNSNYSEENNSEYVDFGSFPSNNQDMGDYSDASSINNYEDNTDYNYVQQDYDQDMSFNQPRTTDNSNSITKKIPIIIGIIILIVLLVLVLKNLLGTEEPEADTNDNPPVEVKENDETVMYKKFQVNSAKLLNGNILLELDNKNKFSLDADITIEFYNNDEDIVDEENVSIKNIPSENYYYEAVPIKDELKGLDFAVKAKLKENKFKDYYNNNIEIVNRKEEEENLLVEIKNDSYSTIDVIELYAIYYDNENNIIGFDKAFVNKLAADKTAETKINYPKDKDYHFVSFSKYEIGINTAYSYKNN